MFSSKPEVVFVCFFSDRSFISEAKEWGQVVNELNHKHRGGRKMITCEESIDRGVSKAKNDKKLVLTDFFNPQ